MVISVFLYCSCSGSNFAIRDVARWGVLGIPPTSAWTSSLTMVLPPDTIPSGWPTRLRTCSHFTIYGADAAGLCPSEACANETWAQRAGRGMSGSRAVSGPDGAGDVARCPRESGSRTECGSARWDDPSESPERLALPGLARRGSDGPPAPRTPSTGSSSPEPRREPETSRRRSFDPR